LGANLAHGGLDQRPTDDRRILNGTSDIIKAPEEKYRRADADNYRKRANHRKDTSSSSPMCPSLTTGNKHTPDIPYALRYHEQIGEPPHLADYTLQ
jgi:hypothetical protein